jgi:hypothetical protein
MAKQVASLHAKLPSFDALTNEAPLSVLAHKETREAWYKACKAAAGSKTNSGSKRPGTLSQKKRWSICLTAGEIEQAARVAASLSSSSSREDILDEGPASVQGSKANAWVDACKAIMRSKGNSDVFGEGDAADVLFGMGAAEPDIDEIDLILGLKRRVAPKKVTTPTRVTPTRVTPTRVTPTRVAPTRVAPTRADPLDAEAAAVFGSGARSDGLRSYERAIDDMVKRIVPDFDESMLNIF